MDDIIDSYIEISDRKENRVIPVRSEKAPEFSEAQGTRTWLGQTDADTGHQELLAVFVCHLVAHRCSPLNLIEQRTGAALAKVQVSPTR
jgi:hypothetical protein